MAVRDSNSSLNLWVSPQLLNNVNHSVLSVLSSGRKLLHHLVVNIGGKWHPQQHLWWWLSVMWSPLARYISSFWRSSAKLFILSYLKTEKSGGNMLHSVPEFFTKIEFLISLTFGAAEIQRNKLDILHLFCLYKKTSIERKYNENKPGKQNQLPKNCHRVRSGVDFESGSKFY